MSDGFAHVLHAVEAEGGVGAGHVEGGHRGDGVEERGRVEGHGPDEGAPGVLVRAVFNRHDAAGVFVKVIDEELRGVDSHRWPLEDVVDAAELGFGWL